MALADDSWFFLMWEQQKSRDKTVFSDSARGCFEFVFLSVLYRFDFLLSSFTIYKSCNFFIFESLNAFCNSSANQNIYRTFSIDEMWHFVIQREFTSFLVRTYSSRFSVHKLPDEMDEPREHLFNNYTLPRCILVECKKLNELMSKSTATNRNREPNDEWREAFCQQFTNGMKWLWKAICTASVQLFVVAFDAFIILLSLWFSLICRRSSFEFEQFFVWPNAARTLCVVCEFIIDCQRCHVCRFVCRFLLISLFLRRTKCCRRFMSGNSRRRK